MLELFSALGGVRQRKRPWPPFIRKKLPLFCTHEMLLCDLTHPLRELESPRDMKEKSYVVQCVILGDYCVLELWIRHLHSNAVGIPLHILGDSFLHLPLLASNNVTSTSSDLFIFKGKHK